MTTIDRPILRSVLRTHGKAHTIRFLERIRPQVEISRDATGLLSPFEPVMGRDLKASGGRLTGTVTYEGTSVVKWEDGVLLVWRKRLRQVSMTVLQGMTGRPITDLLEWDLLDDRMIISGMEEVGINFRIDLSNTTMTISEAVSEIEKDGLQ